MKDITNSNFGLLIAYALPGFVVIWGLSGLWPVTPICTGSTDACSTIPSLIGFFNTTIGAITAGMAVSAIRFVLIDSINHLTGLRRPRLDGRTLQDNLAAVQAVVDHHYRHYQFHSNLLIAGMIAYGVHLYKYLDFNGLPEVMLVLLGIIFWMTSRDNLRKYYTSLATFTANETDTSMSNGMGNHKEDAAAKRKADQVKKPDAGKPDKARDPKAKPSKA